MSPLVPAFPPMPITDHGRPVAVVRPIAEPPKDRMQQLIEEGVLHPRRRSGPIVIRDTGLRLPPGTTLRWLDEDRGER